MVVILFSTNFSWKFSRYFSECWFIVLFYFYRLLFVAYLSRPQIILQLCRSSPKHNYCRSFAVLSAISVPFLRQQTTHTYIRHGDRCNICVLCIMNEELIKKISTLMLCSTLSAVAFTPSHWVCSTPLCLWRLPYYLYRWLFLVSLAFSRFHSLLSHSRACLCVFVAICLNIIFTCHFFTRRHHYIDIENTFCSVANFFFLCTFRMHTHSTHIV